MIAMRLGMLTVRLCLLRSSNARIVDLSLIGVTFAQARWLGVRRGHTVRLHGRLHGRHQDHPC